MAVTTATYPTYAQIAQFLASTINATRFEGNGNNEVTAGVFVRKAAVVEHSPGIVRVDLSDGSFFFLHPEYLVPRRPYVGTTKEADDWQRAFGQTP